MQFKIPHKMTKIAAKTRVQKALHDAIPQLGGKVSIERQEWQGDTLHYAFTAEGKRIEGTLAVEDHAFDVYAKLPLVWRLFEGRIEKAVKEQIALLGA